MRIVSWNCQGGFKNKVHLLDTFAADVLVIQECEKPTDRHPSYQSWAGKHAWIGSENRKGLGIFVKGGHKIEILDWPDAAASLFLPVLINGTMQLIGVWTQHAKPASMSYVGQFWHYLQANRERLNETSILIGDFNSNTIWDKPRGLWSHSICVADLADREIVSLYHKVHNECQGQETRPTFYLHRNVEKPFHIDYAFVHESMLLNTKPNFWMGAPADWLQHSDHMPIWFDV